MNVRSEIFQSLSEAVKMFSRLAALKNFAKFKKKKLPEMEIFLNIAIGLQSDKLCNIILLFSPNIIRSPLLWAHCLSFFKESLKMIGLLQKRMRKICKACLYE